MAIGRGPDPNSPAEAVIGYLILIAAPVVVYVGWVLGIAWVLLTIRGDDPAPSLSRFPVYLAAAVGPIAALVVPYRVRRFDWMTPWILFVGPLVIEVVAFGALRQQ